MLLIKNLLVLDNICSINIIDRSKAKIVNFMKSEKMRHLQVDIFCSAVLMKFYSCESSVTKADFHQRPASIVFIDIGNSFSRYDRIVILDFCLSSILLCLPCLQWLGLSFWFISKNETKRNWVAHHGKCVQIQQSVWLYALTLHK